MNISWCINTRTARRFVARWLLASLVDAALVVMAWLAIGWWLIPAVLPPLAIALWRLERAGGTSSVWVALKRERELVVELDFPRVRLAIWLATLIGAPSSILRWAVFGFDDPSTLVAPYEVTVDGSHIHVSPPRGHHDAT